jgi:hypothetical protein
MVRDIPEEADAVEVARASRAGWQLKNTSDSHSVYAPIKSALSWRTWRVESRLAVAFHSGQV